MNKPRKALDPGKMPTERNFGFTVGGILLAIACLRAYWHASLSTTSLVLAVVSVVLIGLAALAPTLLRWPNILWSKLGDLLFVVMNPVVMFAVYATTFVPIGMYLRLTGRDPLFRKPDRSASTYWKTRGSEGIKTSDMTHQF
jgi:Saxitoxin biosynthesis operon protein SxtJ